MPDTLRRVPRITNPVLPALVIMLIGLLFHDCPADLEQAGMRTTTQQLEELSPIWEDATVFDGGWIFSDWYGYMFPQNDYIMHLEHDWQYCLGDSAEDVFFYDYRIAAWAYTSASLYPWMYWYGNLNDWTYYYRDGRPGSRWFFLPGSGEYKNDDTLNGAVFTETTPRTFPVSGGDTPTKILDPESGVFFEAPAGQSGTLQISSLDASPQAPYPGIGLAIDAEGLDDLDLVVPADDLPDDTFPIVYVYGEIQGAFDDAIGYAERWVGLPYSVLDDGSYSFHLPLTEADNPGTMHSGSYPQLAGYSSKKPRHYYVSKIDATMPDYYQRYSIELQAESYTTTFIGSLKPTQAADVSSIKLERRLSYSYGVNAYCGFNKLRAWSLGRLFCPVIQITSPLKNDSLAHETGHYLTHLLVGHDTYDALENAGGSIFAGNHGIRDVIGRNNLLEDYAYLIESFLKGTGGNYDLQKPDIIFTGLTPLGRDFPGVEGFAASMLACLRNTGTSMKNYLGNNKPVAPLGLNWPDVFEIVAKKATSVDTLRSNIESSLTADKKTPFQILLQRMGWCYYVRGRFVDDQNQPVAGATVRSIVKIGETPYEGNLSTVPSGADGKFSLTGGVFGGKSILEVTLNDGLVVEVPIEIDWNELTTKTIELGDIKAFAQNQADVSYSHTYGYSSWPPNFSLVFNASVHVKIQGTDTPAFRYETVENLEYHEPRVAINIYVPVGSNVTLTGSVSISPNSYGDSYKDIPGKTWTFEGQDVAALGGLEPPVGTTAVINCPVTAGEGSSGGIYFKLYGSLMMDGVRISGVQGILVVSVRGE